MSWNENILALKRQRDRRPLIYGHRGASAVEPENSIRAFQRALDDGADGVELDVRMLADNVLVIAHDENILFDGEARATALGKVSYDEIRHKTARGEQLATLSEVLEFQKTTDCLMNVELKASVKSPLWMADAASEFVQEHGGRRVVISSFDPRQLRVVRKRIPEVPTAQLVEKTQWFLRRAMRHTFLGASGVHPQKTLVCPRLVEKARQTGGFVNVWTVNDPKQAQAIAALGVDGLVTDDPARLIQAFEQP